MYLFWDKRHIQLCNVDVWVNHVNHRFGILYFIRCGEPSPLVKMGGKKAEETRG
jgi:hypothetical protein